MRLKPFLKWAGGKRWIVDRTEFTLPSFTGRYIEPFLGGGAVYFDLLPQRAILSDVNPWLIETYEAIKEEWPSVLALLKQHQELHSKEYYYQQRDAECSEKISRAAKFLYLNRTCWNGLYRENLRGKFNVPIGTKTRIIFEEEDFESISKSLAGAEITCCDFEVTIDQASDGDLLFVDPPYTTAHNMNGFVKYNQKMFSWDDQIRLRNSLVRAAKRGCRIVSTNAWHQSIYELYNDYARIVEVPRTSVISGSSRGRKITSESLIFMGVDR